MNTTFIARSVSTAVIILLVSSPIQAGSASLANALRGVIDTLDPQDWPDRWHDYLDEFDLRRFDTAPRRLPPSTAAQSDEPALPVVTLNGIRIPIFGPKFNSVWFVPGSIAALGAEQGAAVFSRLDLSAHFGHFESIPGMAEYSEYRGHLIDWIDDGLSLDITDIECRPDSMKRDLSIIIHSLMTSVAVLVPDDAALLRIDSPYPALLIAKTGADSEKVSVRYIVQHPDPGTSKTIELVYQFKQSTDPIRALRTIEAALRTGSDLEDRTHADLVRALLNADYERAATFSKALNLEATRFDR